MRKTTKRGSRRGWNFAWKMAKWGEIRATDSLGAASRGATIRSSFAVRGFVRAGFRQMGCGDDAVAVRSVADPARRHREAALRVGAAPVGGSPADALQLGVTDVAYAPDAGLVTTALDTFHHLAYVAHRTPGEGEIRDIHHRLVAELQSGQPGLPGPHLATGLAAARHRRGPRMRPRLVHEALDGTRPGLDVTDGITPGEHHPGHHAVADGGLAAGGEHDALVTAEREVAQGVAAPVPGEQGTQPGLVVLGEPGGRVFRAEGEVDRGDRGQQPESAQGVRDRPGGRPGVVHGPLQAEQAVQHVLEPVRDGGVPDDPAGMHADDDQAERQ